MKNNLAFRINRIFHRRVLGYAKKHISSYPYVSGDSFRAVADMVFDKSDSTVDFGKAKRGTVVFVGIERIDEYFEKYHPLANEPYVLITHNGDDLVDTRLVKCIDEKILAWFAMSATVQHPKLIPIPAGLENLSLYNNGIISLFDRIKKTKPQRIDRVLYGFNIATNPQERQPAYDFLSRFPLADKIEGWPNAQEYLEQLNRYKFVAAPPGNAIESHRMWEAMNLGVVPIVKRSYMMEHFASLGLPILLVENWNDLKEFSESDFSRVYDELQAKSNKEPLSMDYWIKQIKSYG